MRIEDRLAWARERVREAELRAELFGGPRSGVGSDHGYDHVFHTALDARRKELRELERLQAPISA